MNHERKSFFIEVGHHSISKCGQIACGDNFISRKVEGGSRTISVLADGLGSGIKASVLAILSTTMAMKFVLNEIDLRRAANLIMATLPVCRDRKIAYSTFTIVDMDLFGNTKIIEFDNPSCILIRDGKSVSIKKQTIEVDSSMKHPIKIHFSLFKTNPNDRIIFFSDGVSQSGMGRPGFSMGWEEEDTVEYIENLISSRKDISATDLSECLVNQAYANNQGKALDDITCGVIYVRYPRKTLCLTGPPIDKKRDASLASMVEAFEGKKVICGGTTAQIIARELERPLTVALDELVYNAPPSAKMPGFDLITEGTITLGNIVKLLEGRMKEQDDPSARNLYKLFLNSDVIKFVVGSKINQAHQDPTLPEELDIRRNIIRRISTILQEKHLKSIEISYL